MAQFKPTPAPFGPYDAARFEASVARALNVTARVLGTARAPVLAADAPHVYDDKYALAEAQLSAAAACVLAALQTAGLSAEALRTLAGWAREGSAVTLRFQHTVACAFEREAKRDVQTGRTEETRRVTTLGALAPALTVDKTTKVITVVTDYFWVLTASWSLTAFRGTGRDAGDVVRIAERSSARVTVKTTDNKTAPFQGAHGTHAPVDVALDWLLATVDTSEPGLPARVRINRAAPTCATPRRNAEADRALAWAASFHRFLSAVDDVVMRTFLEIADAAGADTNARVDRSVFGAGAYFVPVLFFTAPANADGAAGADAALMDLATVNALVGEATAEVRARVDGARARLPAPDSPAMVAWSEVALAVAAGFGRAVLEHLAEGLGSIEAMLHAQVVAAVGKEVQPADFDAYMRFHAKKIFRPEYEPRALCTSVRRSPEHAPEGVLRINAPPVGDAPADAIFTVSASAAARGAVGRMDFALSAETRVPFGGERHVHAWLAHRFSADAKRGESAHTFVLPSPTRELQLVATARQFSSFIVLIGKIGSATSFEPTSAFIVKDRDEFTIPLSLSEIPTPKEFKDAIASLSPEQQRFCKAFRAMQLESTLFGVLVLHIKPQLERLLNLLSDSLTKEIALTQDLMELFIKYQIPADLLSGPTEGSQAARLTAVKANVAAVHAIIKKQQDDDIEQRRQEERYVRPMPPMPVPMPTMAMAYDEAPMAMSRAMPRMAMMASAPMPMMATASASAPAPPMAMNKSRMAKRAPAAAPPAQPVAADASLRNTAPPAPKPQPAASKAAPAHDTAAAQAGGSAVGNDDDDGGAARDLTAVPGELDRQYEALDADSALRATIIAPAGPWTKSSSQSILSRTRDTAVLEADDQAAEKARAFDLIDALSKSGALPFEEAALHVVLGATHCFDAALIDAVVQDNINPIEKAERSLIIMATTLHRRPAAALIRDEHAARLAALTPGLFAPAAIADAAPA